MERKAYTFKQLVVMISEIETEEDYNYVTCSAIKNSFEADKITWKDHEVLWALADKVAAFEQVHNNWNTKYVYIGK